MFIKYMLLLMVFTIGIIENHQERDCHWSRIKVKASSIALYNNTLIKMKNNISC